MKKRLNLKRMLSLIMTAVIAASFFVPVSAQDISYYEAYKSIKIKGYAEATEANPYVTLVLKNDDEIIGIGESKIGSDGRYEYIFKAPKMTENAVLSVRCGSEDVTNRVYEAIMSVKTVVEVPYTLIEETDKYHVTANLSEIVKFTKDFTVFAAQYNENGALTDCKMFASDELENKGVFEKDIEKTGSLKLFVWLSAETMIPAGNFKEGDGGLLLSFGALADNQMREGYTAKSGNDGYERFLNAKAELPEEMEIIKEQKPDIKRAFYVSPTGGENGDGSVNSPFATIGEAISAYKNLSDYDKESWTAIYLMGGEYEISKLAEINKETVHSQNQEAKLFVGAYNGENVTLGAKKTVSGSQMKAVTEANTDAETLSRIHKDAGQIYFIDYADLEIDKINGNAYGTSGKKPKLLVNGKEQILARYPNGGDTYISNVINDGYDNGYLEYAVFVPTDTKPFTWKNQKNIGMAGQLSVNWYYNHMQAFFDNEQNHVKVPATQAAAQNNGIAERLLNRPEDRSHFYYYNVFEEMDMPGEWCYDDESKRVYIYPDGDINSAEVSVNGDMSDYAVKISGVSDVVLDGITFEMVDRGVRIENSDSVVIQNCEFKNMGSCVSVYESINSGVLSTDFTNVYSGVGINGDPNLVGNLSPKRNFIQDCHFNGVENDCTVISSSSGNIISHNRAENFTGYFTAVFYGSENVIEYNEAFAGGFGGNEDYIVYLDGNFGARANHVRYNYFHDFSPEPNQIVCGLTICMDDLSEEQYVYGNVIKNVYGGIYGNGGDNNVIDGNYIIDCNSSNIWCSIEMGNYMYGVSADTIGNALLANTKTGHHMGSYHSLNLATAKWGSRYPHAVKRAEYFDMLSEKWNSGDKTSNEILFARLCTGNIITNNVGVNSAEFKINPTPLADDTNGDGVSDNTDVSQMFTQTTDPSEGITGDGNGNDYNVFWNNSYRDSIALSDLEVVQKAGMKRETVYEGDNTLRFTYPSNAASQANVNSWEACWNDVAGANFYKLIVATDESFTDIVSEKWLLDNRSMLTFGDYNDNTSVYYYKVQAFDAGSGENALKTPIAETEVRSIERYKQTGNIELISKGVANVASNWLGVVGNNQVRKANEGMLTQKTDDGNYVRFTAPAIANDQTYRMVWKSAYATVESATNKYDNNTTMNVSLKFRFPSAEQFANYADIAMAQWYPGEYAANLVLGSHSNDVKLIVRKDGDKYKMYWYTYGRKKPLISINDKGEEILLKTYTKDELFGKWFDISYTVDMATGIAEGSVDGEKFKVDMNDTTWGENYKWNPENYLRFFDFALKSGTDNEFAIDIKDVNVTRNLKN